MTLPRKLCGRYYLLCLTGCVRPCCRPDGVLSEWNVTASVRVMRCGHVLRWLRRYLHTFLLCCRLHARRFCLLLRRTMKSLNKVIPLRSDTISSYRSQHGAENLKGWSGELLLSQCSLILVASAFVKAPSNKGTVIKSYEKKGNNLKRGDLASLSSTMMSLFWKH